MIVLQFAAGGFHITKLLAGFIRLKLTFVPKNTKKIAFWATLSGLRGSVRTPSIAHWKAHGRLYVRHNWTFFALLRLGRYKRKSVEVGVFRRGWVNFSTGLRGKGRRPPTAVGVRKRVIAVSCGIHSPSFSFVTIHASGGQTELRHQYRALHYMLHGKNVGYIPGWHLFPVFTSLCISSAAWAIHISWSNGVGLCLLVIEMGIIDSNRFGMANRKPTGFDSAMVTSSGRFTLHSIQLFRLWNKIMKDA